MNTKDYTSTILVDKTPKKAFDAIKNFRSWWSEDIEGETDTLGETFFYHYKNIHLCRIKLIEMVPDKRLVYKVVANEFNFTKDKTEWVDTKLIFDISTEGTQTKVKFTHEGLVPEYECYNVCHDAWTGFIQKSLKDLINTGKGEPNPKDGTNDINAENVKKWKLKRTDFTTTLLVTQSPAEVFDAVNNPQNWWPGMIEGSSSTPGDEFTYRYQDLHMSKQKVVEMVPGKKVVWVVTESAINHVEDKNEWTGTKMLFEIFEENDKTGLRFTHQGLDPTVECFDSCSNAWSSIIQQSLFRLITTGKGEELVLA